METPEAAARRIFGARASFYTTSATHTDPQVLKRVVELVRPEPDGSALDVGTGTGHTAFALAPHVARVVGLDLTPEMLAEAQRLRASLGLENVRFQVGDVHALPFGDGAFGRASCRRAAHHFSEIHRALGEIRRVLRPGGRFVVDDRSVPADDFTDALMNELDTWHDASHVREYRPEEWRRMLEEAGFEVEAVEPYVLHRPLSSLTRGVAPEHVEKIHARLAGLDGPQRAALNLVEKEGETFSNHWYVTVAATRR